MYRRTVLINNFSESCADDGDLETWMERHGRMESGLYLSYEGRTYFLPSRSNHPGITLRYVEANEWSQESFENCVVGDLSVDLCEERWIDRDEEEEAEGRWSRHVGKHHDPKWCGSWQLVGIGCKRADRKQRIRSMNHTRPPTRICLHH